MFVELDRLRKEELCFFFRLISREQTSVYCTGKRSFQHACGRNISKMINLAARLHKRIELLNIKQIGF